MPRYVTHPKDSERTVGELLAASWGIQLTCKACNRKVRWYSEDLGRFPAGATLDDLAKRIKCGDCGFREGLIQIINDPGAVQRADMEVYNRKGK